LDGVLLPLSPPHTDLPPTTHITFPASRPPPTGFNNLRVTFQPPPDNASDTWMSCVVTVRCFAAENCTRAAQSGSLTIAAASASALRFGTLYVADVALHLSRSPYTLASGAVDYVRAWRVVPANGLGAVRGDLDVALQARLARPPATQRKDFAADIFCSLRWCPPYQFTRALGRSCPAWAAEHVRARVGAARRFETSFSIPPTTPLPTPALCS